MTALVPLPIVVPLVAAAISIVVGRWRVVQRLVSVVALTGVLGVSIALLIAADDDGFVVHRAGDWPASGLGVPGDDRKPRRGLIAAAPRRRAESCGPRAVTGPGPERR